MVTNELLARNLGSVNIRLQYYNSDIERIKIIFYSYFDNFYLIICFNYQYKNNTINRIKNNFEKVKNFC